MTTTTLHNAHMRFLALPARTGFAIIMAGIVTAKLIAAFAFGLSF